MAKVNTILLELLKLFPRYEFEKLRNRLQCELLHQVFLRLAAVDHTFIRTSWRQRQFE